MALLPLLGIALRLLFCPLATNDNSRRIGRIFVIISLINWVNGNNLNDFLTGQFSNIYGTKLSLLQIDVTKRVCVVLAFIKNCDLILNHQIDLFNGYVLGSKHFPFNCLLSSPDSISVETKLKYRGEE